MPAEVLEHSNTIEECYEFMLAYAAQGVRGDEGVKPGKEIRDVLGRAATAIARLSSGCSDLVKQQGLEPAATYQASIAVLERNARDALAAINLVLAQPSISSQLVDNLNASIQLRALLTDLFLISEVFRSRLSSTANRR